MKRMLCLILAFLMLMSFGAGAGTLCVRAAETEDDAVQAVIAQLEAIDTLQQMQNKRSSYTASGGHYDITTTNASVIANHEAARLGYETYVGEMMAARFAAQQAYDALTEEQKALIDPALVAKLSNYLPTVFTPITCTVTPADDEYTFEAAQAFGLAYEVGNHMVAGNIPQTFILVDTSNGETSWTPSGLYTYGQSNYEITYCCDVETPLEYTSDYKRLNLEDSNYYSENAARHIRAILQNAYPFVSLEEMKANLKAGGLNAQFVDSLTRGDIISAIQMAIWSYANSADPDFGSVGYFATIDVPKNQGIYFTALHDYTNECWDWLPGKRQRTYDARAEYRVNTLVYYLCNLPGVDPSADEIVISNIEVTRADLLPGANDTYAVGMYIYLNNGGTVQDDLKVVVTSYHTNEDGSTGITAQTKQVVDGRTKLDMYIKAHPGDTIQVAVEGTQYLAKGVYFYEPEGGRDASQCLVGVGEGQTKVRAEKEFTFENSITEKGLRIHKTEVDSGMPISDITFRIYRVEPAEGEVLNPTPTPEEIAKYQTAENLVGSVITDATGYAELALTDGTYLVVEEHNTEKVVAPVAPFYIMIPMSQTVEAEDGSAVVQTVDILSIYPKNEPVTPPEEPPIIPPIPDNVTGSFQLRKHDSVDTTLALPGAAFAVYRSATESDTDPQIITCGGIQYAVVPVMINGAPLVLTTDENGMAYSPELDCGTYFLVETKAPAGYNLAEEAVSVTVISSAMTTVTTVEVPNLAGSLLPETGGMGTAAFLVLGGMLMTGAAVLLITKKRMGSF